MSVFILGDTKLIFSKLDLQLCSSQPCLPCKGVGEREAPYKGKQLLQREYKEWCVCCYLDILYSFSQNCSSSSVRASRVCRVKGQGRERLYIKVRIKVSYSFKENTKNGACVYTWRYYTHFFKIGAPALFNRVFRVKGWGRERLHIKVSNSIKENTKNGNCVNAWRYYSHFLKIGPPALFKLAVSAV